MKRRLLILIILIEMIGVRLQAQPPKTLDAADIQLALKKLNVLGSVLYIAAHPDDENSALLAYLAKGKLMRTAYLSITRGEGGQNLIGSEQGDLMGILRTQELLAARRIDGAEQYFTRAIDFGYSKSSEEALRTWNNNDVLADMVWIIRKLQPDVMITRFSPIVGGHGHHLASAILAREAFDAAGDSTKFSDQLQFVRPWQARRLYYNLPLFIDPSMDTSHTISVDVGSYSPLLGKSFTEISGLSRSMHKSQGMGSAQSRKENINYFRLTAGDGSPKNMFDGVNTSWSRIPGGERVGALLEEASAKFNADQPTNILPLLVKALHELNALPKNVWVDEKKGELLDVIKACAGLWTEAISDNYFTIQGGSAFANATVICRSNVNIALKQISYSYHEQDSLVNASLAFNRPVTFRLQFHLPQNIPLTQPYWLQEDPDGSMYRVEDVRMIGKPENEPVLTVKFTLLIEGEQVTFETPVRYRWVDPVEGELYRPFEIVPSVAVNLDEKVYLFPDINEKNIPVRLYSNADSNSGSVRLNVHEGWNVTPSSIPFHIKKGEEQVMNFTIRPPRRNILSSFNVEVVSSQDISDRGMRTIQYSHIPRQTVFPVAEGKLIRTDIHRHNRSIGYIMGSGDLVPSSLKQLGYSVTMLSDEDLGNRDLSVFNVIIAGVRAYNTRSQLLLHQKKLMEYVHSGGTYIVQYFVPQQNKTERLGPYPFNVSSFRVSEEDAPMTILLPGHPLLNAPNAITQDDFKGWVQERGLNFADTWDSSYTTILGCHDAGEPQRNGGLLFANYGKGVFIYTGYSWFRQLPAGVPGAYRIFTNMIESNSR